MSDLLYISVVRFPTEKAHGLQIAQNCEAFVRAGYNVRLWVAQRVNTAAMQQIDNIYDHYGIEPVFGIQWLPCVDLYPLAGGRLWLERVAFYVQLMTYIIGLLLRLLLNPQSRADIYYSRDEAVIYALSWFIPAHKLAYEAHLFSASGGRLQQLATARAGHIIAITPRLRDDLIAQRHARPDRVIIAHDGIRAERFTNLPDKATARRQAGWAQDAIIVGFVGRLRMLRMDKGIGTLIDAVAIARREANLVVHLALVGGPADAVAAYRQQWLALGLPDSHFLYTGQVPPDDVPLYLRAFDICAMPHPFTEQYAYYTSPLKLFEYMAAGRAIIASDLPGWSDVVQHEKTALLVPAGRESALAQAVQRLSQDVMLREQLARRARKRAFEYYTWEARARKIRAHIEREPAAYRQHTAS